MNICYLINEQGSVLKRSEANSDTSDLHEEIFFTLSFLIHTQQSLPPNQYKALKYRVWNMGYRVQ
jgi:hypothetical protein